MGTRLMRRRDFVRLSLWAGATTMVDAFAFTSAGAADGSVAATHTEQTLNALVDTFIPSEPDSPGAAEVCALDVIRDPSYRFSLALPVMIAGLDGMGILRHGRLFKDLSSAQQASIVEFKFRIPAEREIYLLALVLTRLAYYGAVWSDAGIRSFGYPGPSAGYQCSYSYNRDPGTDEGRLVRGNFP